jgi:serpin B
MTHEFDAKLVEKVNDYIESVSRGLISKELSPASAAATSPYIVINTLTFIAKWKFPFRPVAGDTFHRLDGTDISAPFLFKSGSFHYGESQRYQYIAIPYAHSRFQFEVIVPKRTSAFKKLARAGVELFDKLAEGAEVTEIDFNMPRFELKPPPMDFSQTFRLPGDTEVSQIATMAVNEFGTTAAAATIITEKSVELGPKTEVKVNRPFLFVIRGKGRGEVLFAGAVVDPV